ncbi:MAG: hypothetical protein KDA37_17860, partial [Planctomycetales bacterium]|nr:hypothetical protein [Planctomycetales bacterium]
VFQSGNYIDPDDAPGGAPADGVLDGADTGWNMFRINNQTDQTLTQMPTAFSTPPVTTQTAPDAYSQVRDFAGNWWWNRDSIDSRVIGNLTNFTGVTIGAASPVASELNGVLTAPLQSHAPGYDTDGDAMPDDWETAHGLNPASPGDWNLDFDNDGYINLIEFINELGEFPAPAPIVFDGAASQRYADILNWKTDDSGASAGTNWQPSKYDTAVVHSGVVTVDSVGQHAGVLNIAPSASDNAQVSVAGGWLMVEQKVNVGSTSGLGVLTLTPSGTLLSPLTAVQGLGELNGTGELIGDLINAGAVSPGASIGSIEVSGDYDDKFNSRLTIELSSTSSFDTLHIGGQASLTGALELVLLEEYSPEIGDQFEFLTATGGVTGAFATTAGELPALEGGLGWEIVYGGSSVVLTVVSAGLPGDYNSDGVVDAADYTVWRDGGSPDSSQAGYQLWRDNYGASQSTAAQRSSPVPEPAAALLVIAILMAARDGRRHTTARESAVSHDSVGE